MSSPVFLNKIDRVIDRVNEYTMEFKCPICGDLFYLDDYFVDDPFFIDALLICCFCDDILDAIIKNDEEMKEIYRERFPYKNRVNKVYKYLEEISK